MILLLFVSGVVSLSAQVQLKDSAKISLLTASPWYGQVYAFFGHSAIRIQDDSTGIDVVFNYGYFDSSQPHFIYNFVRGKTDYILGTVPFQSFIDEYAFRGQEVVEQELNLSFSEKQQLFEALVTNALPENRGYRYNFLYDNCSTRLRDMVEHYTDGVIQYPSTNQKQTYRDLLHECVDNNYPWLQFGIDLIIGSPADSIIDVRNKMFIPKHLMTSFDDASILRNDTLREPLISNVKVLLPVDTYKNKKSAPALLNPLLSALGLLLLSVIVSLIQILKLNKARLPLFYDSILFGIAGLAGVILLVLMFFSEHPATNPNWNFIWLNPAALIPAILLWMKWTNKVVNCYHFINFALLTLFLFTWWFIPQQMPVATVPFSMSLWLRSGANSFMLRKRRLKNRQFTTSRELKAGWGGL